MIEMLVVTGVVAAVMFVFLYTVGKWWDE